MTEWHPQMNHAEALHGAHVLLDRLEAEGPTPGSPFDFDAAIRGLERLIERLEPGE